MRAPGGYREPMFNIPRAVMVSLVALLGVHAIRSILPQQMDLWVLLTFAFIPARYDPDIIALPGEPLASFTSFATYMFLHGDMMHLVVNALWLLAFGSAVARRTSVGGFFAFSLLCGVAGAVAHLLCHISDVSPVVGASAAISGQMAAAIRLTAGGNGFEALNALRRDPYSVRLPSIMETLSDPKVIILLGFWVALNYLFGMGVLTMGESGLIAWEAHIGGLVAGLFTFGAFDRRPRRRPPPPFRVV